MCIAANKLKFRMQFPGTANHFLRKIKPKPTRGLERCKQIPLCATNLENVLIWTHVKTVNLLETLVIPGAHAAPGIMFPGNGIPMSNPVLLVNNGGWVGERSRFHSCMILRGGGR